MNMSRIVTGSLLSNDGLVVMSFINHVAAPAVSMAPCDAFVFTPDGLLMLAVPGTRL